MSSTGKSSASLPRRCTGFMAANGLLDCVAGVHVGFSGGADSTALLLLLRDICPNLEAVHLHHGIRGAAADADAGWCAEVCRRRGIAFSCHRLDVPAARRPRESLEMAARRCRLEFWRAHCRPTWAVALGHHLDDCLETMLLRLARGANSSGLTGLRPLANLEGVRFIRPLLDFRRTELEDYLRNQGVSDWCEDASNRDHAIRRNAVRGVWLPAIRAACGHDLGLLETLASLRDDAAHLDQEAAAAFAANTPFANLPAALLPRVLRLWLRSRLGHEISITRPLVERLAKALAAPGSRPCRLPLGAGLGLQVQAGELELLTPPPPPLPELTWQWCRQPRLALPDGGRTISATVLPEYRHRHADRRGDTEVFALDSLPETLRIRGRRPGDRIAPFGGGPARKLQDLLVNAKIPAAARASLPLLLAGDRIIWVPGVCRAEFGRLPPAGGPAVALRLE